MVSRRSRADQLNRFFAFSKKLLVSGLTFSSQSSANSCNLAFCAWFKCVGTSTLDPHVQIPGPEPLDIFDSLALEPEGRARLRAGGHFDAGFAAKRRDFDLRAEGGLDKTHRHFANQVVAVALKNFVRFDVQHHVKIAGGRAAQARLAVAGGTQARAGVHAGGIRNLILDVRSRRPVPWQVLQGFSMTRPAPSQRGQVWAMLKIPRELITCPRPPQVAQGLLLEPASPPEPLQTSHRSCLWTLISFSQPCAASSKVISMS